MHNQSAVEEREGDDVLYYLIESRQVGSQVMAMLLHQPAVCIAF